MSYMMDFFASDSESKVLSALADGKVQYPAYVFIRDEENNTGRLAFVDKNNTLKYIRDDDKKQVVNMESLPDIADGDTEVLYVVDGVLYLFDGMAYQKVSTEFTEEVTILENKVTNLETENEELIAKVAELEEAIANLSPTFVELE